MKELHIECAGAGKTYGIAEKAANILSNCPDSKKIYIITYTNYAVSQIKTEIRKKTQEVPPNIIIDTIHGFLLNNIIYPFSNYVKGLTINTCSIEKLHNDLKFKNKRIKQLKEAGIIHSSEVIKYAKSIITKQTNDKKVDKAKKDIILDFLVSDIYCLFVDESQDMAQDFFDLILPIINKINNFYFVGDPNQAILSNDCYRNFVLQFSENKDINTIYNLTSRRIPQSFIPLCNKILPIDFKISSISDIQGKIEYILLSDLSNKERFALSKSSEFTYIKEKTNVFTTKNEKPYLPSEISGILYQKFPEYDNDALKYCAKSKILKDGVTKFLRHYDMVLDKKTYAILCSQFSSESGIPIYSIHKVKGLEKNSANFIICKSLLEILIGDKNNYDRETSILYVALTRTKNRLLLIVDNNDNMEKYLKTKNDNIENIFSKLGISKLNIHQKDW